MLTFALLLIITQYQRNITKTCDDGYQRWLRYRLLPPNSVFLRVLVAEVQDDDSIHVIKRSDFPEGFIFGAASSAYQVKK